MPQLLLGQILVNGLTTGMTYALVAYGLSMVFGVLELVNWAHGQFYMVGAYFLFLFVTVMGWPYAVACIATVTAMSIFGMLFQLVVIRPVIYRPWQTQLVVTLGASVLLINLAAVLFGTFPLEASSPLNGMPLVFAGVSVSWQNVFGLAVAAVAFAVLHYVVRYTRFGKAMRAVSQNRDASVACGISIQRMGFLTFGLGAALAGVAAAVAAPLGNISPDTGSLLIFKAFAVVIMAGFGSVSGVIPAALLLGLAESFTAQFISSDYVDAVAFAVMLVVLVVRPQGLFGRQSAM